MPEFTVKITPPLDKLGKAFKKSSVDIVKSMNNYIREYAELTEYYAKQVTPVGTPASTHKKDYHGGTLRARIGTEIGHLQAKVGTRNVKYAVFVHEGTRKMRARPFLKWGFDFATKKFNDNNFADRLDKDLRKNLTTL